MTACLKVEASDGIPVLLKLNEAVYNAGSPVTLLSEYQIRDRGYTIDSVATKHRTCFNTYGIQEEKKMACQPDEDLTSGEASVNNTADA